MCDSVAVAIVPVDATITVVVDLVTAILTFWTTRAGGRIVVVAVVVVGDVPDRLLARLEIVSLVPEVVVVQIAEPGFCVDRVVFVDVVVAVVVDSVAVLVRVGVDVDILVVAVAVDHCVPVTVEIGIFRGQFRASGQSEEQGDDVTVHGFS